MQTANNQVTKPWGNHDKASVLVIGHDPRLQTSNTIAEYCFFADYYFRPKPTDNKELAKYGLANSLFSCIKYLTEGRIRDDEILITNLCNEGLPHPLGRKTVLIPRDKAENGLMQIRELLTASHINLIFPMSQQVNYWLQELGFYQADVNYLQESKPKATGLMNNPPYYQPNIAGAFKRICGKQFIADSQYYLFPILHVKSYPLKNRFLVYEQNYVNCKNSVKQVIDLSNLLGN